MNRLHSALSPYLLQHADNPVHWRAWDDDALAQARRDDKPILLSVGYAACHWCHVMARESFADAPTAALMNAHFVNIKVDREERPDLDQIYQAAHYVLTRAGGGWPLTIFLTPDGAPFFSGTYFPKTARPGLPAFAQVLERVAQAWREKRDAIGEQNKSVVAFLRALDDGGADALPDAAAAARAAMDEYARLFDRANGGFGGAPKFPHAPRLAFCLTAAAARAGGDAAAAADLRLTLEKIAGGGLFDHIGGGFFRYCVDGGWRIPHFEKMLGDNGQMLALLADAQRAFPDSAGVFADAAQKTAGWLLDEMRDERGGFYSSLDADSPGGEGAFYLWDMAELRALLTAAEYDALSSHYGLAADDVGVDGKKHLAKRQTAAQTAAALHIGADDCRRRLAAAAAKLAAARARRPRPPTDDKILTAWNALAIRGLARAGRLCGRGEWTRAAADAFAAVFGGMRAGGRTAGCARGGRLGAHGFLDDVAFLLDAALELLRADFRAETLQAAQSLAAELVARFADDEGGGFFFTAADGEKLIRRIKNADDNAAPAGNAVAAGALLRLAWLTGDAALHERAGGILRAFAGLMRRHAAGCPTLLCALRHYHHPPAVALLCGDMAMCEEWRRDLEREYDPDLFVYCLPAETGALPPPLQKTPPATGAAAYVCDAFACRPPVYGLDDLRALLKR